MGTNGLTGTTGWSLCSAGSSSGSTLYWRVDYNSLHRGYIVEEDDTRFCGIVCEQGRNPYSPEGVIEKVLLAANGIGDAIEEFESYCFANAYQIR